MGTVAEGNDSDVCRNCGIWRVNAGYVRESCGKYFGAPGCFVTPAEPVEETSEAPA